MTIMQNHKKIEIKNKVVSIEAKTGLESLATLDRENSFSPDCRADVRDELHRQVEDFLSHGGHIQEIEPNVMADPPKKPVNNYGSRPI